MDDDYKSILSTFRKTKDGITSFARVEVLHIVGPEPLSVETNLKVPADQNSGEIAQSDALLCRAAEHGVRIGIASENESPSPTGKLVIQRIIISPVDTSSDAEACAAAIATHQLLSPKAKPLEISCDRPWRIKMR